MKKRKLIYILSPSYSGSTLLTMLMARHPKVATIGELKATSMGDLSNYVCSCGTEILKCSFWDKLSKRIAAEGDDLNLYNFGTHFFSENPLIRKVLGAQVRSPLFELVRNTIIHTIPSIKTEFNNIVQKNQRMIEAICDLHGKEIFLDGSKDPHRLLYFIKSEKWDIQVIYMFRDGRAQSNSNRQKIISRMNYAESSLEWKRTIMQMREVLKYLPKENVHSVKYEYLCSDPNEVMDQIWDFLKLDKLKYDWKEVDIRDFEHHILGNSMRTKQKIYIALDEGWRSKVTNDELNQFNQIAGSVNRSLGYE